MVVAITCYGMATFEGPMLSLKNVNAISHFTDWTIAHVHVGALGWNGFLTFGVLYWIIPKIFNTQLHSRKLATTHFWFGTLGIILYAVPLYWAGFEQAMMWKSFGEEGNLKFQFMETVTSILPMYMLRSLGGLLYLTGVFIMIYNIWKTVAKSKLVANEAAEAAPLPKVIETHGKQHWHRWIERRPIQLLVFSLVAVAIGGILELVPTFLIKSNVPTITSVKPYTPLELQGRDIYIREGCYTCHSQMIRPFRDEVERYGEYSKAGEFVYDHPFQWGSKRTGPDLARIGGKYNNSWHFMHMLNPRNTSDKSIMPNYPWLFNDDLDQSVTRAKIQAMQTLGVPYEKGFENVANEDLNRQANEIANNLRNDKRVKDLVAVTEDVDIDMKSIEKKEIIALIAYLQRVGTDIKKPEKQLAENR
jgi:cytochrome c oxidase cbb3-type subunit I/II